MANVDGSPWRAHPANDRCVLRQQGPVRQHPVVRCDTAVNFDWGTASPIPAACRWTTSPRAVGHHSRFTAGDYQFTATAMTASESRSTTDRGSSTPGSHRGPHHLPGGHSRPSVSTRSPSSTTRRAAGRGQRRWVPLAYTPSGNDRCVLRQQGPDRHPEAPLRHRGQLQLGTASPSRGARGQLLRCGGPPLESSRLVTTSSPPTTASESRSTTDRGSSTPGRGNQGPTTYQTAIPLTAGEHTDHRRVLREGWCEVSWVAL